MAIEVNGYTIQPGADLSGADLRNADLSGVELSAANLNDADLSGADLSGAILLGVDLRDADLSGADLSGADLRDADLSYAYLTGANIYNAIGVEGLSQEQLASTVSKVPTPTIDLNDADGVVDPDEVGPMGNITGTGYPNTTITLVSKTFRDAGALSEVFEVAVDGEGHWAIPTSIEIAYSDGVYELSATAKDQDGNISDPIRAAITLSRARDEIEATDTFKVTAAGGKYFIDGEQAPVLELQSGKKYEFDLSDSSLVSPNHPLKFKLDGQTWNEGVEVTGTLGVDQIVTITVPDASEGVLSYYCKNHPGMGNDINTYNVNTQNPSTDTEITGSSDSEVLEGSDGDDVISGGDGADLILAGAGNDTIIVGGSQTFSSSYQAVNTSSTTQVGTGDKVTLEGMLRVEDVIDGGADTDTIELGEGNVSLFLHDALSGFHSSVELSSDSTGEQSKARLENIEQITGNDSDVNLIDLTSPDYSLDGQSITVDGAGGRDIIWGSDADETIKGGEGDDELFGGAGTNVLTGGLGADEFQFTMTSTNDSVTDFNAAEGDTLKLFNTGGATFNRDSVTANSEGDGISIEYSHNDQVQSLNISLGLSSISDTDELLSAIEII